MNNLIQNKVVAMIVTAALVAPGFAFAAQEMHFVPVDNLVDPLAGMTFNNTTNTANQNTNNQTTTSQAYATGTPSVETVGASRIANNYAEATIQFSVKNANWSRGNSPLVSIEYKNMTTGVSNTTNVFYQDIAENHVITWTLYSLQGGTNYQYRAVMKYAGHTYRSDWDTFSTTGGVVAAQTSATNTTSTTTANNTTTSSASNTITSSVNKLTASAESAIYTAGSNHANGVAIGITDAQARVSQDDTVTFTVEYQNTRTTSLLNSELAIQLPEEYEYISSKSDFQYDDSSNVITLPIGRIASGGAIHTVSFKARAIGTNSRDIKTTATLYYESGKIAASDRDAFHGGSKSILGASVFGAGFFPQTMVGWLLIVFLITVLIVAARRYIKQPAPQAQPAPAK